jgi:hypothetical protein
MVPRRFLAVPVPPQAMTARESCGRTSPRLVAGQVAGRSGKIVVQIAAAINQRHMVGEANGQLDSDPAACGCHYRPRDLSDVRQKISQAHLARSTRPVPASSAPGDRTRRTAVRESSSCPDTAPAPAAKPRKAPDAAIEAVRPQCGRELWALVRVKVSGSREPSRSSDGDFSHAVVTSPPTGGSGFVLMAYRGCLRRSSEIRKPARRSKHQACAGTFLAPAVGLCCMLPWPPCPGIPRGGVCGSTRPAPDGRLP